MQTDMDIEATGLVGPLDGELAPRLVQITDVIKPRLVGWRLTDMEQVWARLDGWAGHGFPLQPAMAAVDIALWDALARARGMPLFALLGGRRREIPVARLLLLCTPSRSRWSSRSWRLSKAASGRTRSIPMRSERASP